MDSKLQILDKKILIIKMWILKIEEIMFQKDNSPAKIVIMIERVIKINKTLMISYMKKKRYQLIQGI